MNMGLQRNIEFGPPIRFSHIRRMLVLMYKRAELAQLHGHVELEAGPALEYVARLSREHDVRVTITHFLVKVAALLVRQTPELNYILRRGRFYPRKTIDVSFAVSIGDDSGLVGLGKIENAERKTLVEIARDVREQSTGAKRDGPREASRLARRQRNLPGFALRAAFGLMEHVLYTFNLWSPSFGLPRDLFGSLMVDNVGFLGVDHLQGTPPSLYRAPMALIMGQLRKRPVVRGEGIVAADTLTISFVIDHRFIDGPRAGRALHYARELFADPARIDDLSAE